MRILVTTAAIDVCAAVAFSQGARSVWSGVYTAEQAKAGRAKYVELCGSCHGESLEGGESAPPLAGGEFLANWNTLTVGDLFDRTRATMPQNKPGSMNREVGASVISFLLSANKFPEGKDALPTASESLREIKIEAVKPEKK